MAITRRELALLAAWAQAQAQVPAPTFQTLTPADARELEALAAQIIPSGATPGAKEAGVIHFIDRALATFDRAQQKLYQAGLAQAQATRRRLFPASRDLATLPDADLITLLKAIEKTDFFAALRTHTLMGFLADPSYGGNRNHIGWKHIGHEAAHHFTPPFGFYDAKTGEK